MELTWINFDPSIDKENQAHESVGWNYLSIRKLERCNYRSFGIENEFHLTQYHGDNYLSMLGLKLNHVSKGAPVFPKGHDKKSWAL